MDVLPNRSKVFLSADADRSLVAGAPALVDPDGAQHALAPEAFEAMQFVDAARMPQHDLRSYVADGEIPFRSSEYVDWVRLADVLALNQRLKAQRREALDEMLSEPLWEDGNDAGSAADSDQ